MNSEKYSSKINIRICLFFPFKYFSLPLILHYCSTICIKQLNLMFSEERMSKVSAEVFLLKHLKIQKTFFKRLLHSFAAIRRQEVNGKKKVQFFGLEMRSVFLFSVCHS